MPVAPVVHILENSTSVEEVLLFARLDEKHRNLEVSTLQEVCALRATLNGSKQLHSKRAAETFNFIVEIKPDQTGSTMESAETHPRVPSCESSDGTFSSTVHEAEQASCKYR